MIMFQTVEGCDGCYVSSDQSLYTSILNNNFCSKLTLLGNFDLDKIPV